MDVGAQRWVHQDSRRRVLYEKRCHSQRETPGASSSFGDHRRRSGHAGLGQRREAHNGSGLGQACVLKAGKETLVAATGSQQSAWGGR